MLRGVFAARTPGGRGRGAELGDLGDGARRGTFVRADGGEICAAKDARRAVGSAGGKRGRCRLGGGIRFSGRRSLGMRGVGM